MSEDTTKNILFIIPAFGGILARIANLIANTSKNSIHVLYFDKARSNLNNANITFYYGGPGIERDGIYSKCKSAVRRALLIKRFSQENNIDTVISFLKESSVPAVLSGVFDGEVKTVVGIRNNPRPKFEGANGRITALIYKLADLVVTNSKQAAEMCEKDYGIESVTTIQNPVDYEGIKEGMKEPVPDKHTDIFDSRYTFINVGRLSSQKGQWHLIRAFKKVVDKHPDAKLVILGDGYLKPKLQKLIKRCGLKENVYLLGHQDNVFLYLSASDCFVLSSLHEGLPNVVLEAKTVGLPIISTDCDTGPREILAPELSFDENISYPYEVENNTLTPKLSGEKIYLSPKDKTMQKAEKLLAQVMISQVNKPKERKGFNRDSRFEPEKISEEWIKILSPKQSLYG